MPPRLPDNRNWERIDRVIQFVEPQLHYGSGESFPPPFRQDMPPIRGFLLQNVYGGGSGVCRLAYQAADPNTTQVSLVGVNYTPNSKFKLALWGVKTTGTNHQPQQIFQTLAIPVNATAAVLSAALLLASSTANLLASANDFGVELGNPTSDANLILNQLQQQPEVDFTQSPPVSYVGSWIITVTGILASQYNQLNVKVVQDTEALMFGLAAMVAQPIVTMVSDSVETVWDISERPLDYPWSAGSLITAINFPGFGYGIIGSNFRSQAISLPAPPL